MGSVFDELFAESGVPALMEMLGTAEVVYQEPEEDDVTLTAIVGNMEVVEDEGASSGGRRKRYARYFLISRDPDGPYGGVAEPRLAAVIVYDGQSWAVESIESQGGTLVRLGCERIGVVERSRQGYRS